MKPLKVVEKVGMTVDKIKYCTVVNSVALCSFLFSLFSAKLRISIREMSTVTLA